MIKNSNIDSSSAVKISLTDRRISGHANQTNVRHDLQRDPRLRRRQAFGGVKGDKYLRDGGALFRKVFANDEKRMERHRYSTRNVQVI